MTQETRSLLDRFHSVLVEEIRENNPELLDRSFTVAEIYQNLVPYRSHRDRIGVEMNADYEQALLELLAGEGDYLVLESRAALRQIREELESLNPDTGIYRDFAAVDVHLNPEELEESEALGGGDEEDDEAASEEAFVDPRTLLEPESGGGETDAAGAGFAFVDELDAEPSEDEPGADAPAVDPTPRLDVGEELEADDDDACRWCRGELPDRDDLHFCPHCGSPVDRVPCPDCGTELDPEWRFCVACGTDVGSS